MQDVAIHYVVLAPQGDYCTDIIRACDALIDRGGAFATGGAGRTEVDTFVVRCRGNELASKYAMLDVPGCPGILSRVRATGDTGVRFMATLLRCTTSHDNRQALQGLV